MNSFFCVWRSLFSPIGGYKFLHKIYCVCWQFWLCILHFFNWFFAMRTPTKRNLLYKLWKFVVFFLLEFEQLENELVGAREKRCWNENLQFNLELVLKQFDPNQMTFSATIALLLPFFLSTTNCSSIENEKRSKLFHEHSR